MRGGGYPIVNFHVSILKGLDFANVMFVSHVFVSAVIAKDHLLQCIVAALDFARSLLGKIMASAQPKRPAAAPTPVVGSGFRCSFVRKRGAVAP